MIHESAQATDALRGIFITFEGGEGAGKTTHIRFLSETLRAHGREVLCLREPGGTEVGEQLRAVVLDPANGGMSDEAELLIYEAARAQLMAQVIAPALASELASSRKAEASSSSTSASCAWARTTSGTEAMRATMDDRKTPTTTARDSLA